MKTTSNISDNYWAEIDKCPIWNYNKVYETRDLSYLWKDKGKYNEEKAHDCWVNLRQQVIDKYGTDAESDAYYQKMIRLSVLKCELIITKRRFLVNEIKQLEREIKDLEDTSGSMSHDEIYMQLTKYLGVRFDPKKYTVVEYKEALKMMQNESDKLRKHGKTN